MSLTNLSKDKFVLDQFCTLMASYTQKVASFLNDVDLPVKQLADYTNFEGLC